MEKVTCNLLEKGQPTGNSRARRTDRKGKLVGRSGAEMSHEREPEGGPEKRRREERVQTGTHLYVTNLNPSVGETKVII